MQTIRYRRDLYKLLQNVGQAIVVELGVAEGLFSRDMCQWGVKQVISVDLWESHPDRKGDIASSQDWHNANYANAKELLKPFGDRSKILRGPTTAMAQKVENETVDLVYIDADHSYTGCIQDIHAWWGKLKSGGICAFHDYMMPQYGVNQAVKDFAGAYSLTIYELAEDAVKDAGCFLVKP